MILIITVTEKLTKGFLQVITFMESDWSEKELYLSNGQVNSMLNTSHKFTKE